MAVMLVSVRTQRYCLTVIVVSMSRQVICWATIASVARAAARVAVCLTMNMKSPLAPTKLTFTLELAALRVPAVRAIPELVVNATASVAAPST